MPLKGLSSANLARAERTRRWLAAKKLKLEEVPARELLYDGLEAEQFLIESNRQREKTKVQRLREYKRLKEIEAKLAAERQKESQAKSGEKIGSKARANLRAPSEPRGRSNRSDERAAATVGLKPRTAEKGLEILNRAERGGAEG